MSLTDEQARRAAALAEHVRPIFAGVDPHVIGAALADLLATWLAGHVADDAAQTIALRRALLLNHIARTIELIPVNEQMLIDRYCQGESTDESSTTKRRDHDA